MTGNLIHFAVICGVMLSSVRLVGLVRSRVPYYVTLAMVFRVMYSVETLILNTPYFDEDSAAHVEDNIEVAFLAIS
jgi:hypothetical protein